MAGAIGSLLPVEMTHTADINLRIKLGPNYSSLIPAALMIGHHFSISAL
jgi:hypothetical protein